MSDFLMRLAERALGTAAGVQPRVASQFQDEGGGDAGFTEVADERESAPSAAIRPRGTGLHEPARPSAALPPASSPAPAASRGRSSAAPASSPAAASAAPREPLGAPTPAAPREAPAAASPVAPAAEVSGAAESAAAPSGDAFAAPALSSAPGPVLRRFASDTPLPAAPVVASADAPVGRGMTTGDADAVGGSGSIDAPVPGSASPVMSPADALEDDDAPLVPESITRRAAAESLDTDAGAAAGFGELHAELDVTPTASPARSASTDAPVAEHGGEASAAPARRSPSAPAADARRPGVHAVTSHASEGEARTTVGRASRRDAEGTENGEVPARGSMVQRRAGTPASQEVAGEVEESAEATAAADRDAALRPVMHRAGDVAPAAEVRGEAASAAGFEEVAAEVETGEPVAVRRRVASEGGDASASESPAAHRPIAVEGVRRAGSSSSTENAGEASSRAGSTEAREGGSAAAAAASDAGEEWLVPGGARAVARTAQVQADAGEAAGFEVVEERVEDGRVVRTARREVPVSEAAPAPRSASAATGRGTAATGRGTAASASPEVTLHDASGRTSAVSRAAETLQADAAPRAEAGRAAAAVEAVVRAEVRTEAAERRAERAAARTASAERMAEAEEARAEEARGTALVQQRSRTVPVAATVAQPQRPAAPQPQAAPERPVVHVTIGRIEVRAVTPPVAPQPQPAPGWQPPVLSLDDYLKRGGQA